MKAFYESGSLSSSFSVVALMEGVGIKPNVTNFGNHIAGFYAEELDLVFLSAYSIDMYFSGHLGDRIDLRLFLATGMLSSGVLTIAFGLGYWWDIHRFSYYLVVQIVCGLFQSTGWPCVVAVVGNWFGMAKRGLIMGVWTLHSCVGNILCPVIALCVFVYGWGWSFVLPALFAIMMRFAVHMFLIVSSEGVEIESPSDHAELTGSDDSTERVEAEDSCLNQPKGLNSMEDYEDLQSRSGMMMQMRGIFIPLTRLGSRV